jgi:tripartite-type tricarboxylate transporter receptor subunit TctC
MPPQFTSSTRRRTLGTLGAVAGLAAAPRVFAQQPWPERPIRFIVNAPPGGTADVVARFLGEGLSPVLGRPVVVENKAGGSGTIGLQEMLRAPPDGHAFMVAVNGAVTEIPHSMKFPVDPLKDVRPVVDVTVGSLLLVSHPSVPARTLPELVEWVRSQPQGVSYASYSPGSLSHILGVQFARAANLQLTHVGYRGSPPAMQDLLAGTVPLMFNSVGNVIAQLRERKLRAYAIAATERSDMLPELPTFPELGYPALQASTWIGLWCAPQVPAAIVQRMHAETARWLTRDDTRQRMRDIGMTPARARGPDDLARSVAADFETMGSVLRSIGFRPEA